MTVYVVEWSVTTGEVVGTAEMSTSINSSLMISRRRHDSMSTAAAAAYCSVTCQYIVVKRCYIAHSASTSSRARRCHLAESECECILADKQHHMVCADNYWIMFYDMSFLLISKHQSQPHSTRHLQWSRSFLCMLSLFSFISAQTDVKLSTAIRDLRDVCHVC